MKIVVRRLSFVLTLAESKLNQKILLGPSDTVVHPGQTIQLPCIVTKQSDAVVTWCWNDFCTLGKTHLLRHETTIDGVIGIYQYTSYPRFQLSINERLSMYRIISQEIGKEKRKKNNTRLLSKSFN
jgi:hypothetical protein